MKAKYSDGFYKINKSGSLKSANLILPKILNFINVRSAIDFGCGVGTWLYPLKQRNIEVLGIDFNTVKKENFLIDKHEYIRKDLRKPLFIKKKYDMAISLEVIEHLEKKYENVFIENICRSYDTILFSGAIVLQGGYNHVNERPQSYWIKKFNEKGYTAYEVRDLFWNIKEIDAHYKQNIILFSKKNLNLHQILIADLVHPDLYQIKAGLVNKVKRFMFWKRIKLWWINFTNDNVSKHFYPEKDIKNTVISIEYPEKFDEKNIPYYPINNDLNNNVYIKYLNESKKIKNTFFGGRLGSYKYLDMDITIEEALKTIEKIKEHYI